MIKHTQTICRQQLTNFLSVFDHFVGLALKGLRRDVSPLTEIQYLQIEPSKKKKHTNEDMKV